MGDALDAVKAGQTVKGGQTYNALLRMEARAVEAEVKLSEAQARADRLEGEVERLERQRVLVRQFAGILRASSLGENRQHGQHLDVLTALPQPEREDPPSEDEPDEEQVEVGGYTPFDEPVVAGREACPTCKGTGRLYPSVSSIPPSECPTCHGTGTVSTDKQEASDGA